MSRIELPATDTHMQDLVDRYGQTTVTIGLNQIRTQRLDRFIDEFIGGDAEPIDLTINGREESYTQKYTSAVTLGGMMVHTRIHTLPHTVEQAKQYVLVVDNLFTTEPEEYWFAGSRAAQIGRTTSDQTEITATEFVKFGYNGLYAVEEEDEEESTDPTERCLERALARAGIPQMSYGDGGWRLRVGPELHEDMHSILTIQQSVARMREELKVPEVKKVVTVPEQEYALTGSDE